MSAFARTAVDIKNAVYLLENTQSEIAKIRNMLSKTKHFLKSQRLYDQDLRKIITSKGRVIRNADLLLEDLEISIYDDLEYIETIAPQVQTSFNLSQFRVEKSDSSITFIFRLNRGGTTDLLSRDFSITYKGETVYSGKMKIYDNGKRLGMGYFSAKSISNELSLDKDFEVVFFDKRGREIAKKGLYCENADYNGYGCSVSR